MGIERYQSAKYWRTRAEKFRIKAANAERQQTKETLSNVAKTYDQLAKRAEEIGTRPGRRGVTAAASSGV
jgi:hypothetical protein